MNSETIPVDLSEYAALANEGVKNDPGMTTRELGELWGIGITTAKTRVAALVKAGKLLPGIAQRPDARGRQQPTPVYAIMKKGK